MARAQNTRKRQLTPLPAPQPANREGLDLDPSLTRRVHRGLAQINRGQYKTFDTTKQATDYIFTKR